MLRSYSVTTSPWQPEPDAAVVLRHDFAVAAGAGAVEPQGLALVVRRVLEVLRAAVTVGAELLLVDRAQQDLVFHVELELFTALGVGLDVLVTVALQTVVVLELFVVALGVDELFDLLGGGGSAE
jgi:hypothetical protein